MNKKPFSIIVCLTLFSLTLRYTMCSTPILSLPTEVVERILFTNDVWHLARCRQVCSYWRRLIDIPLHWRQVCLVGNHHGSSTMEPPLGSTLVNTWSLDSFQYLLNPHLLHIHSLTISGVRDSTVRLILDQCTMLEELHIMSFNTLSNHALTLKSNRHLKLRRFVLSGGKNPFFSIDALSLAHFLSQCPLLNELTIDHCLLCIHPVTFLDQLGERHCNLEHLTSLTLAGLQHKWSPHHVGRLLKSCPNLNEPRLTLHTTASLSLPP